MLIKNSKVLTIGGKWLHPSGESPIPPGPQPGDGWKNITGSTGHDDSWQGNHAHYQFEIHQDTWGNNIHANNWLNTIYSDRWCGKPDKEQTTDNIYPCGTTDTTLPIETEYNDYALFDINSMYYLETLRPEDYYYPSYGKLELFDIVINYQTTSSTGLSYNRNTQSNETIITISETNGNSFQVKIGDTLGNAGSCSNTKILFDLNNHITYALCRPVPNGSTYDPTDFTNLKWHILKENNGYDSSLLTMDWCYYYRHEFIGKFDRTTSNWINSNMILDKDMPRWGYKGTLNLPIDNEAYHDYT